MTERTVYSGSAPFVIIRSGGDVVVHGYESDRVLAGTSGILGLQITRKDHAIEVEIGGNGQVLVPQASSVIVYSGKNAEVHSILGQIRAIAAKNLSITECGILKRASAGGEMNVDCRDVAGNDLSLIAGWHLRCWLRDLKNVKYLIDDLGGKRQVSVGGDNTTIRLNAGGDVTLISAEAVPYYPIDGVSGVVKQPDV